MAFNRGFLLDLTIDSSFGNFEMFQMEQQHAS
jgi:hypothetical protein